jgi:hypothetical protein
MGKLRAKGDLRYSAEIFMRLLQSVLQCSGRFSNYRPTSSTERLKSGIVGCHDGDGHPALGQQGILAFTGNGSSMYGGQRFE